MGTKLKNSLPVCMQSHLASVLLFHVHAMDNVSDSAPNTQATRDWHSHIIIRVCAWVHPSCVCGAQAP